MTTPIWHNEYVRFAPQNPDDAPLVAAWWSDRTIMEQNVPWPLAPMSYEQARQRITNRNAQAGTWVWMIVARDSDAPIGQVSLELTNTVARVGRFGIMIGDERYRGRGYGRMALRLLLRFCFEELNLHRVELNVMASNAAAIRTYTRLGFEPEGALREAIYRNGQRVDWLQMGLLRAEWQDDNELR